MAVSKTLNVARALEELLSYFGTCEQAFERELVDLDGTPFLCLHGMIHDAVEISFS